MRAIISTIVRDDETYLDEWIDYHTKIGFDHFVIYDHKSKTPLQPKWNNVTIYRTERRDPHHPNILHNNTLLEFKAEWISLLDCDEFIVLHKHKNILELLDNYKNFGGLAINYVMYGSSGHKTRPVGNVKDNYLWRTPFNFERNIVAKCILNTKFTQEIFNQHGAFTSKPIVTEDFKMWNGVTSTDSTRTLCRINHYYTRSFEEWKRKVEMGNREKWQQPRDIKTIEFIDRHCTVMDDILKGK